MVCKNQNKTFEAFSLCRRLHDISLSLNISTTDIDVLSSIKVIASLDIIPIKRSIAIDRIHA